MDFKQLKYFLTIMDEGNLTKAAKKLHISQPPLSQQLKNMEEELHLSLFSRHTRTLKATRAAELLHKRGLQIIDLYENTLKELRDLSNGLKGTLSLGFVASSGAFVLSEATEKFKASHKDVRLQLREGSTYRILELLNSGAIELGFVRTPFNTEPFNAILFPEEPMAIFYHEKYFDLHPEKARLMDKTHLCLSDLQGLDLMYDLRFEQLITRACHSAGFDPHVVLEGEDSRTLLLFALSKYGVAVLPQSAESLMPHQSLVTKPIEAQPLTTECALVWLKNRPLSEIAQTYINAQEDTRSVL